MGAVVAGPASSTVTDVAADHIFACAPVVCRITGVRAALVDVNLAQKTRPSTWTLALEAADADIH